MNIGLLGFGVVGRGVYDMLAGRDDIRAAWVLCRRDLGELTARTTYEMQDILDDPAVDTVVEVMGGLHPAYEYVAAALRAGKNVVSSNKYLMCRYYDELTALAKEHGAALRCTAAVGGGIPWLTNLEKAARANHISREGDDRSPGRPSAPMPRLSSVTGTPPKSAGGWLALRRVWLRSAASCCGNGGLFVSTPTGSS